MVTRRTFLQSTIAAAVAAGMPWHKFIETAYGAPAVANLSDPFLQPKFTAIVPNALDPGFLFDLGRGARKSAKIGVGRVIQQTGLIGAGGTPVSTPLLGYGDKAGTYTWPGRTFQVNSGDRLEVKWENRLQGESLPIATYAGGLGQGDPFALSPIDTSLHWAYSLHGYTQHSIASAGIPIVPHVHGGHQDFQSDGNPEFFFSPNFAVRGPQWAEKTYYYDNSQPAGTIWYHDHALGITRLNVYAGMAGFYIIRDKYDTGDDRNRLSLPVFPYEAAFAIQDKMFTSTGELFYPSFPGDPFYDDFITGEDAVLPPDIFPGGGATGLAEFFGDHFVVNGIIWPKMDVEPRHYRLRLLNGCDSRFLAVRFRSVAAGASDVTGGAVIPFTVIGSDQGIASSPTSDVETLIIETGSRYDILFDFSQLAGKRVIIENLGGDDPFGGGILMPEDERAFPEMNRIMAFDVTVPLSAVPDVSPNSAAVAAYVADRATNPLYGASYGANQVTRTRKVALFEGKDEFGRLQPLLGTAEPAADHLLNPVAWPATPEYQQAVLPDGTPSSLVGPMEGSIAWHSPTTENPALGATEEWEIWNVTGDAHPIHLHLVHFEIVGRQELRFDSIADEDGFIPAGGAPAGDGIYLVPQPTVQHNTVAGDETTYGSGFRIVQPADPMQAYGAAIPASPEYVENAPKDMVTALPGQVTRIRATFDKPGRYVWHCHILSHEDHEMMRVMHVGPGA